MLGHHSHPIALVAAVHRACGYPYVKQVSDYISVEKSIISEQQQCSVSSIERSNVLCVLCSDASLQLLCKLLVVQSGLTTRCSNSNSALLLRCGTAYYTVHKAAAKVAAYTHVAQTHSAR
eukprot:13916-Heterococcus_DN1.PRE.3